MTTVKEISEWPVEDLKDYVRKKIPKNEHFYATREQLILMVARIMDMNGELDPDDSKAIAIPGFDRIFVIEEGDYDRALYHMSVDVVFSPIGMIAGGMS
jgi:hypothetical protein